MTIFERFAKWAEDFFSRDNVKVVADDIDHLLAVAGNSVAKLQALIASAQAAMKKLEGEFATSGTAADSANDKIAAIAAESETAAS